MENNKNNINNQRVSGAKQYYLDPKPESKLHVYITKLGNYLLNITQVLVFLTIVIVFLYLFVFPINIVNGISMEPNFCDGDIYITYKLGNYIDETPYEYGDVIAFKESDTNNYIKRVIGVPGDKISIIQGKVYRNQQPLDEKYLPSNVTTNAYAPNVMYEGQIIVIPQNKYFVLGDNRPNSIDSRVIGLIDINSNYINGKVIFVLWPLNRMRIFDPWQALPQNECN